MNHLGDSDSDSDVDFFDCETGEAIEQRNQTTDLQPERDLTGRSSSSTRTNHASTNRSIAGTVDLLDSVKGMYRILDLVSERGSDGTVAKVIIAQESLKSFINDLKPGAHVSFTKINFKVLDSLSIKPMGVYGSREAIAELLFSIGAVSRETVRALTSTSGDMFEPLLRSGLYVVRTQFKPNGVHQLFVIYWPEHSTWNDNAATSVCRNRITFMRYLTKITDQVIAVISPEHAKAIVWQKNITEDDMDVDNEDEDDRLFTFEISQTNEQEEDVTARRGFKIPLSYLTQHKPPADCPVDPVIFTPRLVAGDTVQGILEATYIASHYSTDTISSSHSESRFQTLFQEGEIHLHPGLKNTTIETLVKHVLKSRFPQECKAWERQQTACKNEGEEARTAKLNETTAALETEFPRIQATVTYVISARILELYPVLTHEGLGTHIPEGEDHKDHFHQLQSIPQFVEDYRRVMREAKLETIDYKAYHQNKLRILGVIHLVQNFTLEEDARNVIIQHILDDSIGKAVEALQSLEDGNVDKPKSWLSWFSRGPTSAVDGLRAELRKRAGAMTDAQFMSSLSDMVIQEPLLQPAASDAIAAAHSYFAKAISKHCRIVSHRARSALENQAKVQCERELNAFLEQKQDIAKQELIQSVAAASHSDSSPLKTSIDSVEVTGHYYKTYKVTGTQDRLIKPAVEYKLKTLELSRDDQERLRMDNRYIPHPRVEDSERRSHSFRIPWDHKILYMHLLMNDRCLLILGDKQGNVLFYCDKLSSLENAVRNHRTRKTLHRDKISQDTLIAFDESKRMLAVCSSAKLQLHIFVFDEPFAALNTLGTAFNLTTWYPTATCIRHMCFIYGSDEVLLVDSNMQARIFSTITQQFRPASLNLEQIPSEIYSSPDGSCFLTRNQSDSGQYLTAYHWSTFGSSSGIKVPLPQLGADMVLSSLLKRTNVHLVMLDVQARQCSSLALDITSRVTQFTFNEKGSNRVLGNHPNATLNSHNCLLDCHAEVWTRFPVQPAIQRQTITASSHRRPKSITFITDRDHNAFAPHFSDLISTFERATRKPTGTELKNIVVKALPFNRSLIDLAQDCDWSVSCFKAGEWLVDILCLIPIQIAVTRENRFIPLKDGVYSAQFEKSLLGAEVNTIVNDLSFGWYESIFQSYMATKPVKVVSSMGEQSVGKSYSLNHLADTSFAGSAMRTTEGVWMSVAPTEDCLVVALDFEGVDSLERSVQEDTFLVLFNTAISNLVLFRNNFAFSRDIKGLFQSFQSSSTVLNPAANPSLFQSTLVIIIKDVVDSDKMEIKREFQSKFQQIVQEEQDGNFITRLHGGKLNIIPWPVIASPQFYTLFPVLARRLEQQKPTHPSAGAFLYTLKTLMAKLKANDWGALSQTLIAHRAQSLLDQLPNALTFGLSEIEPEMEPLKNFDTDTVIDAIDTQARFQLSEPGRNQAERELRLAGLIQSWELHDTRHHQGEEQWTIGLEAYLSRLVDMRIAHVTEWLSSNLSRFKAEHANVEALRRTFDSSVVDLRANILICKLQCQSCHLSCLHSRHHEGSHDCQTNHECIHPCDFSEDHASELSVVKCGFSAGHSGRHICVVNTHLCGEPCMFYGRPGCLQNCTKMIGHPETDHACSSTMHACGQPCDLRKAGTASHQEYTCSGTCAIPIHDPHDCHQCHERQCPITCQLCRRLCAAQDHLHGLEDDAVHLCGQPHSCNAACSENGICEIETAPHSIEATFTGTHETFQYTKYTQVAKRLPCAVPIGVGEISHAGPHKHSEEQNLFHFCTTRCESCGYYCTLPLGHTQPTHETSHGSMSRTQWAIDGPAGTILELNNRKFGVADEGAPMMCNMICQSMGRHVHIDYCRATVDAPCRDAEIHHITTRMSPNPQIPKDFITHSLFWRRSGFKDPYSREDQATFAKCDAMCPGQEHTATPADRSYCTLPLFHDPHPISRASGMGYVSNDGHSFSCKNPAQLQQSFHVIFVIDRSGSMASTDRCPLQNTPVTTRITARCNNRLGAVYSSLHAFWFSRQVALNQSVPSSSQQAHIRRDAYSILLFDHEVTTCIANDFTLSADQLLNTVLAHPARGGTNYTAALNTAKTVMMTNWSTERTPVIIFLSDGECSVTDQTVQDVCRAAVARGKPLSLQSVSFGPQTSSTYLRRMAQIALEFQNNAPPDPLQPRTAVVSSSYSEALDTVRLAETFLGFAEALVKPRGALLRKA